MHFQICGNNDGNIIHVFKNCISISVGTVLEVSKMTVPIGTFRTNKNVRLIAINRELTHDDHAINRD